MRFFLFWYQFVTVGTDFNFYTFKHELDFPSKQRNFLCYKTERTENIIRRSDWFSRENSTIFVSNAVGYRKVEFPVSSQLYLRKVSFDYLIA